jgi:hypothetical protein
MFLVAGDKNLSQRIVVQHSIFLHILQGHVTQQQTQNALLRFHPNNGYTN